MKNKTQTLSDIIAICNKCHGVKHFKNSVRLGFGEEAQKHFINTNQCSEMQFVSHLHKALLEFEERNKIFRWEKVVNLEKFGGKNIEIKQSNIPLIKNPYENVDWYTISYNDAKKLFKLNRNGNIVGAPAILSIYVDNFQGIILIKSLFSDKIEWYLDKEKIKTKYNNIGLFSTKFKIKNIVGKELNFKLTGIGGETISKPFEILTQEVL